MTTSTQEREFEMQTGPLRNELLAHCYRMLGSTQEAEDQVQETYLRAWRAYHQFEGRSSIRTWMYRIATNTCLTALGSSARRQMPTGLGQGPADPQLPVTGHPEMSWLEPLPDALVGNAQADPSPEERAATRNGVRLALIAALQDLPPRQRAVLVLRDVLGFSAQESADVLESTVASCNSALQRARAQMADRDEIEQARLADELTDHERELLDRYAAAFENYDIDSLVDLLASDATWEMPPFDGWFTGAPAIMDLIRTQCPATRPGDMRMIPAAANGQPAFALYMREDDGVHRAFHFAVLDIVDGRVSHVRAFFDRRLFAAAGLPDALENESA